MEAFTLFIINAAKLFGRSRFLKGKKKENYRRWNKSCTDGAFTQPSLHFKNHVIVSINLKHFRAYMHIQGIA